MSSEAENTIVQTSNNLLHQTTFFAKVIIF